MDFFPDNPRIDTTNTKPTQPASLLWGTPAANNCRVHHTPLLIVEVGTDRRADKQLATMSYEVADKGECYAANNGKCPTSNNHDDCCSYRQRVFKQNYQQIVMYVGEHGTAKFPGRCQYTRRLSNWMHRQFKRKNIPDDERIKLDLLREYFDVSPLQEKEDKRWNFFLQELIKYRKEYHTFVISKKDDAHRKLYDWKNYQKKLDKSGNLRPERKQKLVEIGLFKY